MKTLLFLLIAYGIVGHFDYQNEVQQVATYCENVKAGYWPDYLGSRQTACPEPTPELR